MRKDWCTQPQKQVYEKLDTSAEGLSEEEAKRRLDKYGKNEIEKEEEISPIQIFLDQFKDFLIWILLVAAIISFAVGHTIDTYLIMTIVLANGIFGFVQDYKAEKSIESLKEMATPEALVERNGQKKKIGSEEVVPGDIIHLSQGAAVPADARLIGQQNLEVDESALTGESVAVN
ncbi:MAG: HAD-IC family P-type ATPase, partial [Candidatus Thermoplasmatota archaeon]